MAVNLVAGAADTVLPIDGVELGWAEAGVQRAHRKDVLLIRIAEGASVAGVFTQNRFCAAPVQVCRAHLASGQGVRAIVVNTGNANAGTGAAGLAHARQTCDAVAGLLGIAPEQVLPFSTGVILEPLPVERIIAGLPAALAHARPDNWLAAAETIMTTDTVPKAASARVTLSGAAVRLSGISKGSGMIHPNMATMLGFIATDANVDEAVLRDLVRHAADHSFNRVTVDGDTSTNDAFVVIATGRARAPRIDAASHPDYPALRAALTDLAQTLAQKIVRDGEGATKFMTLRVEGGRSEPECRQIAQAIARSPLVKTAFYASDPNLGRILAAIGAAGVTDLEAGGVNLWLDDVWVAREGGRHPDYREEDGQRVMRQAEITVRIALGRGDAAATVWTCDFSHDYVSINANYRS